MGDFNTNLQRYNELITNKKNINWKYQLIQTLDQLNFTDLQQISQNNSEPTWYGPRKNSSRIDAIFCSNNLIQDFLFCGVQTAELYQSDHRIVIAYFQYQHLVAEAMNRRLENKKYTPLFQAIDPNTWEKFTNETTKFYNQQNFKQLLSLTPSISHINYL